MYQYQNISCTVLRSKIQLKTSSFRRVAASIKVLCSGFFTNTILLDALILVLFLSTKKHVCFRTGTVNDGFSLGVLDDLNLKNE